MALKSGWGLVEVAGRGKTAPERGVTFVLIAFAVLLGLAHEWEVLDLRAIGPARLVRIPALHVLRRADEA